MRPVPRPPRCLAVLTPDVQRHVAERLGRAARRRVAALRPCLADVAYGRRIFCGRCRLPLAVYGCHRNKSLFAPRSPFRIDTRSSWLGLYPRKTSGRKSPCNDHKSRRTSFGHLSARGANPASACPCISIRHATAKRPRRSPGPQTTTT